ncbi:Ger(x)C family spore germination protein [Sutcliffiella rhizosphaerae]|uniref:Ger(X)C family spore germination protein n=1 Tax=Sutcliffiella rhizosphaerae TaxID=2880967 RepID=A0ABM8YPP9_9BACI|nr:Ger(x)C family spore germination protein [Sutcliffiella rhizosphaerae]CAG9621994.1 hypothetical protein BACCIP111883_02785 [Sutcliffiella rhizosphaerae]
MKRWTCILLVLLLTSCVQQKPLEELGLVTAIGYDKEENQLKGTIIYYEFDPLHPSNTKMVTATSKTSKGIRYKENLSSSKKLVSGQLRVAIYGRELAEEGIISTIDTLSRDSEIGTMSYLSVSEIPAEELLSLSQESIDISNAGTFLYNLIGQNVRAESLISPTLHEFMQAYYSEGKDPILPLINFRDNTIVIDGMAIFYFDKVVGSINNEEAFYLKLFLDPYHAGNVEIGIPKENVKKYIIKNNNEDEGNLFVSLDHLRSDINIELDNLEGPEFNVDLIIKTRMQEITENYDLGNPAAIRKIEKEIGKTMKRNMEQLIKKLQEMKSDPVGFGNNYRAKVGYKAFKMEDWKEHYQNAKININVNIEILRTGVMD